MAVTSIWPITGSVDSVIKYAVNPEKTTEVSQEAAALHAIDNVVEYTADQIKTEQRMYVAGINCQVLYAREQFIETKLSYGKLEGRTCYHGYQSFRVGEVDADTAHKIGVALAEELWGERFEVVVATHLNTGHYHNHFVVNSVSFMDGRKYYNTNSDYIRMREVSDRLCKEYSLSVIKEPERKAKHYAEWSAEQNGKPTFRGMVKADIDRAILASTTMRDFHRVMMQMGYTFKQYTKNGRPLAHAVVVPPGGGRGARLDKLGDMYTFEGITERILQNMRKRVPFPETENRSLGRYRIRGNFQKFRKATGLRALYLCYCYRLKIIMKRPAFVKRMPISLREDILKLDRRIEETKFLGKYGIGTASELTGRKQYAENQICALSGQRNDMRNSLKRVSRQGEATEIAAVKAKIAALTAELKRYRREVKLCDAVAERSGLVKEGLELIIQQKNSARKEKEQNEHGRRRSGAGRQNGVGWR